MMVGCPETCSGIPCVSRFPPADEAEEDMEMVVGDEGAFLVDDGDDGDDDLDDLSDDEAG